MKKYIFFAILTISALSIQAQILKTLKEDDDIVAFAATPDGKILLSSTENNIKVWNSQTGEMITTFKTTAPTLALAVEPNGLYMASSGSSFTGDELKIWNIAIGRGLPIKHTHKKEIISMDIDNLSKYIATGSEDKTIKIFNITTYEELVTLKGHTDDVTSVKFSHNGRYLLSGSKDKMAKLWDLEKNVELLTYNCGKYAVLSACFSPDDKYVAIGTEGGMVLIFNIEKADNPKYLIAAHKKDVNSVAFTPDNQFLATGSSDNTFKIWDMGTGKEVFIRLGVGVNHIEPIRKLLFAEDGRLFTQSEDQTIKFWNWGFPILQFADIKLEDNNGNQCIEGTEPTSLVLKVTNSGYGEALKSKFKVTDKNLVKSLKYNQEIIIGDIPAKSEKRIMIPIEASQDLLDSVCLFSFTELTSISNQPIPALETSIEIKTVAIPILKIDEPKFIDTNSDYVLTGKEAGDIVFNIWNEGAGLAKTLKTSIKCDMVKGIELAEEFFIGDLASQGSKEVKIPINGTKELGDGILKLTFNLSDNSGLIEKQFELKIKAQKYIPTLTEEIKEYVEVNINEWQKKGKFERTEEYQTRVNDDTRKSMIDQLTQQAIDTLALRNLAWEKAVTEYDADNESFKVSIPNFMPFFLRVPLNNAQEFDNAFASLTAKNQLFTISGNNFALLHLDLLNSNDSVLYTYDSQDLVAYNSTELNFDFEPVNVDLSGSAGLYASISEKTKVLKVGRSDVDMDIPETTTKNKNTYALIIGNEDYSSYQSGLNSEVNVDCAVNDAKIFKEYALKTLGIPEENITLKTNATLGQMKQSIIKLTKLAELSNGEAELLFYYSGHGLPDEETKEGYIMPVDISGTEIKSAIKLNDLYAQLSAHPVKKVTVILDACFTGGARNASLIAMKGVKIKPKESDLKGNLIVFTSSSGEESSAVYREKNHGMFTYFLLLKLKETKGDIDYKTLFDQVGERVKLQSVLVNNKEQTPQLLASPELIESLATLKINGN